jgi:hypothetical protein
VFYPTQTLSFSATIGVPDANGAFDLSLQPLDAMSAAPVGDAWTASATELNGDGTLTAKFPVEKLPVQAFPALADPLLELHNLEFDGVFTSAQSFCGNLRGYGQVLGVSPSDRIALDGSTFGAISADGAAPAASSACPGQ